MASFLGWLSCQVSLAFSLGRVYAILLNEGVGIDGDMVQGSPSQGAGSDRGITVALISCLILEAV